MNEQVPNKAASCPVYGASTLHSIAMLVSPPCLRLEQVFSWMEKTQYLRLSLRELPAHLQAARAVHESPGTIEPGNELPLFDGIPELRLRMNLEFIANTVYSLAEVASAVANKVTARTAHALPTSFHAICKDIQRGKAPARVSQVLGDVS